MKLEEIKKKFRSSWYRWGISDEPPSLYAGYLSPKDIEELFTKLYYIKGAVEKHKQECYFSNPNDAEFMGYQKEDAELYKSAEDL